MRERRLPLTRRSRGTHTAHGTTRRQTMCSAANAGGRVVAAFSGVCKESFSPRSASAWNIWVTDDV